MNDVKRSNRWGVTWVDCCGRMIAVGTTATIFDVVCGLLVDLRAAVGSRTVCLPMSETTHGSIIIFVSC